MQSREVVAPPWYRIQLRETVEWCLPRVRPDDPKHCLRSEALTPPEHEEGAWLESAIWIEPRLIHALVAKRHAVVEAWSVPWADPLQGGRLLVSAYDYTNHNGMSTEVTGHFMDDHDVPPWDTWVCEIPGEVSLLVSWVPREFVSIVQEAIESECMGMLTWADSTANCWFAEAIPSWLASL